MKGRKPFLEDQKQGICITCNKNKQTPAPRSKYGFLKYLKECSSCQKKKYGLTKKPYQKKKKPHCERCGFIPKDKCQLDVHHIDRNNKNNNIENLLTLCANCHRLEHKKDRAFWATLSLDK